jgi:RimJ/RimL family protein N-acetyltransferase
VYNPYISGRQVYLRHPTLQDVEGPWHEWLSDEETTRWLGERYWPNSVEKQKTFYDSWLNSYHRMVLSIIDVASDKHIGVCNLSNINWVSRHCDIAIIIGDRDFRHGPHLIEAMSLLLRIAFMRLNMRNIKSSFVSTNEGSQAIHNVFRFREVGRLPGFSWDRGRYVDCVISMLTADEWFKRNMDLRNG